MIHNTCKYRPPPQALGLVKRLVYRDGLRPQTISSLRIEGASAHVAGQKTRRPALNKSNHPAIQPECCAPKANPDAREEFIPLIEPHDKGKR